MKKETEQMIRWSLLSSILVALLWATCLLESKSVPTVKEIWLNSRRILHLPFGISRWWDVFTIPAIVYLFLRKKMSVDECSFTLVLILMATFPMIFFPSLVTRGLDASLLPIAAIGLIEGLAIVLVYRSNPEGTNIAILSGLLYGLFINLIFGAVAGIGFILLLCLVTYGTRLIFGQQVPINVGEFNEECL